MSDEPSRLSINEIFYKAFHKALGGGTAGAFAMVLQVLCLMWLRTMTNYQYRTGCSTKVAFMELYKEGGLGRFYQGLCFALIQAPLSRFGDTAANTGVLQLLKSFAKTKELPIALQTFIASFCASLWRIVLMPVDAMKTTLQVEGEKAVDILLEKVKSRGFSSLYDGGLATSSATLMGHFPWFFCHNYLNSVLPLPRSNLGLLLRNALIGFICGLAADFFSNGLRVIKTIKQTSGDITYGECLQKAIEKNGPFFWFRGMGTKMISGSLSSIMFAVLWKYFEEKLTRNSRNIKYVTVSTK